MDLCPSFLKCRKKIEKDLNLTDKHVKNEMEFCRMFPSEILNFDPDSHLRQPFSYYDEMGEKKQLTKLK